MSDVVCCGSGNLWCNSIVNWLVLNLRQEEERRRREEEMMRQREIEEQMRRKREESYRMGGFMDNVSNAFRKLLAFKYSVG